MDKRILAKENVSKTTCTLQDDGYWKAVSTVTDRILYEGDDSWREEIVDAMSIDKDPQNAIQTAMGSTLNFILMNVYQAGFNSLVEYREFERKLKAN